MKPIRLSAHATEQARHRGATEEEIAAAIREGQWRAAERGRLEVSKDFPYNAEWNGKLYSNKRVRPIFTERRGEVVVVTVYVYYFCEEAER